MYGPDSYIYESNLTLLATLSDEELADPQLIAQLTPGNVVLAELGAWLGAALARGLAALAAWYAPPVETPAQAGVYWLFPPL